MTDAKLTQMAILPINKKNQGFVSPWLLRVYINTPAAIRTRDLRIRNLMVNQHKDCDNNDLQKQQEILPLLLPHQIEISPDLEQIITAWPELPDHIKQTIQTLVGSVKIADNDSVSK